MKRIVALVCIIGVAACGGSKASPYDVARATVADQIAGKSGGIWDRAHPDLQARMPKADYVACVTALGGSPQTAALAEIESIAGTYVTTKGARLDARAVTVGIRLTSGENGSEQVWLVDVQSQWRVVQIVSSGDTEKTSCMKRL